MLAEPVNKELNIDRIIANYSIKRKMDREQREKLFKKVIGARAILQKQRTAAYDIIIDWVTKNPNHPTAPTALKGVSHYLNEGEDFSKLLVTGTRSNNSALRNQIASLLKEVIRESQNKKQLTTQISTEYDKSKTFEAKTFLINIAAASGTKEAISIINDALNAKDADLVRKTYTAISNWPNDKVFNLVINKIKSIDINNKEGAKIRLTALGAAVKMLNNEVAGEQIGKPHHYTKLISVTQNDPERLKLIKSMGASDKEWMIPLLETLLNKSQGSTAQNKAQAGIDNVIKNIEKKKSE